MFYVASALLIYAFSTFASWALMPCNRGPLPVKARLKRGWVWWVLALLYRPFGDLYMYDTTIGDITWTTCRDCAGASGLFMEPAMVRHEGTHARQAWRLGWGNVWVGLPAFAVLYFLLPLPVGLAWFRYRFELEAYTAQRADLNLITEQLSGKAYLWAWPRAWVTLGVMRAHYARLDAAWTPADRP